MHRVTEQRWAGFFWILLSAAITFQLIAFVSPAWLKIFINFKNHYIEEKSKESTEKSKSVVDSAALENTTYLSNSSNITNISDITNELFISTDTEYKLNSTNTSARISTIPSLPTTTKSPSPPASTETSAITKAIRPGSMSIPVNQDYALWYMTQCHMDTWKCETLTYYHIAFMDESYDLATFKEPKHWFLDRTHLFLDGAELRFDYSLISESQGEYTFGLLACAVAWWLVYRHRKRLRKKSLDKVKNTRMIVAAVTAFFSGLFVLIPVGRFGNMGDRLRMLAKDYPQDISVYKPIGLGFGAAGGTFAMFTGLIIALRLVLRGYCPDCVDLPQQDEIAMTERGNQADGVEKHNS